MDDVHRTRRRLLPEVRFDDGYARANLLERVPLVPAAAVAAVIGQQTDPQLSAQMKAFDFLTVIDNSVVSRLVQSLVYERHRHRFEFNCLYEPALTERGMRVSGRSPDGQFVEIAELPSHPWFVAVQFHPEFQSKPLRPHPLFASFVEAAHRHKAHDLQQAGIAVSR